MKIYFKTFGCRVNQYETQLLRERLMAVDGARSVGGYEEADLCVVNTCAVTREADKDSLQLIRRIAKRNPSAKLVVTGCYATHDDARVLQEAPAAVVCPNSRKDDIPALLGLAPGGASGVRGFSGHSRAFVKVQDGCDMRCTYCIVPSVRPGSSCKTFADLEAEVRGLVDAGFAEIVLCGVRMGRYLVEHGGKRVDFVGMLERLLDLPGDFRLRLSSLEVTDVTPRFLDLFSGAGDKLCPSLHLPLQSGSASVLERMGRWYSPELFTERAAALKERRPGTGLFTDIMAGFPGETGAEADESFDFIRRNGFSGLHVFRYSPREGTPAAGRGDQVSVEVSTARARALRDLDRELRESFAAAAVGSRRRVLVERTGEKVEGLTDHFLRVSLDHDPGEGLRWARITGADGALGTAVVDGSALVI